MPPGFVAGPGPRNALRPWSSGLMSCADVVKMSGQLRHCQCGQSSGRYLDDGSTVEQTRGSISIALHNHELRDAISVFHDPHEWHPLLVFRAFLNPLSETDVVYLEPSCQPKLPLGHHRLRKPPWT